MKREAGWDLARDLSLLTLDMKRKPALGSFQRRVVTCRVATDLGQLPGARLWLGFLQPWSKAFKGLISWLWNGNAVHWNLTLLHENADSGLCNPRKYQWSFGGPFV